MADITYIRLETEFVYLAMVLDAYSRRVIGWALDRTLEDDLTLAALRIALERRIPPPGLVHHSDRRIQYASADYTGLLKDHQITISMSRKGNPYDNAACESFMKTLKYEEVHRQEYRDLAEAQVSIEHFLEGGTTRSDSTRRSAIDRRWNSSETCGGSRRRPTRESQSTFLRHDGICRSDGVRRIVKGRCGMPPPVGRPRSRLKDATEGARPAHLNLREPQSFQHQPRSFSIYPAGGMLPPMYRRTPIGRSVSAMSTTIRILLAATICAAIASAQHAVKGEFQETLHAKADKAYPAYKASGTFSGKMRSVGADTMEALMKLWIEDYKKLNPGVEFSMEAKASGTAGPALTDGTADLGPVAREMLPAEEDAFVAKFHYEPLAIRVAGGSYRTPGKTHAICFWVNKENPIKQLNFDQIDALFSKTHKRGDADAAKWGDVGLSGDWADKPVHLWGLIRPNGIAHFLEGRILIFGDWKDGINERTTVGSLAALDAIAQGVAADPYAIGYAGFGNDMPNLKTVALSESKSGPYVRGTFEEVVAQKYPLSRVVYIYVNRAPGKPVDPKVRDFLTFVLSRQGQADVEKEGIFLPLPLAMAKEDLEKLK